MIIHCSLYPLPGIGMLAVASIANSAEGGSALLSDVANTVEALQSTTDTAANPLSALLGVFLGHPFAILCVGAIYSNS